MQKIKTANTIKTMNNKDLKVNFIFYNVFQAACGPVALLLLVNSSYLYVFIAFIVMLTAEALRFFAASKAINFTKNVIVEHTLTSTCTSVYHMVVFVAFLGNKWVPIWAIILIFLAELTVPYIRTFLHQAGKDLPIRFSSGLKSTAYTLTQLSVVSIALGVLGENEDPSGPTSKALMIVAALASIFYLTDHLLVAVRKL